MQYKLADIIKKQQQSSKKFKAYGNHNDDDLMMRLWSNYKIWEVNERPEHHRHHQ